MSTNPPLVLPRRRLALAIALIVGLGAAPAVLAQGKQDGCLNDPDCKGRYDQAIKLYDAGKYADALPEFQAAYSRRQMPWLMLNIGRTLQRLGRPQEAIAFFERYKKAELNLDPAALERVNKYIEQARALVESPSSQSPPEPAATPIPPAVKAPPPPVSPPPQSPALNLTPSSEPAKDSGATATPVYKKWWLWTIVGVVVAGAVAGGVAGALLSKKSPPADPILPTDPVYTPTF